MRPIIWHGDKKAGFRALMKMHWTDWAVLVLLVLPSAWAIAYFLDLNPSRWWSKGIESLEFIGSWWIVPAWKNL